MAKHKRSKQAEYDDDASDPYSDELNVSSPELLEMDDEGEVVLNSDWTRAEKKKQKEDRRIRSDQAVGAHEPGKNEQVAAVDDDSAGETQSEDASDGDDWESESEDQVDSQEDEERKLSSVSFGTLAKAQSLAPAQTKKRKREGINDEADEKLAALRFRLKEIQNGKSWKQDRDQLDNGNQEEDHTSDSSEDEHQNAAKGRTSKHAPMISSSKKQVTRKRSAVDVPKSTVRDPRFDPSADLDRDRVRNNYAFLDGYVDSEIKDLKSTLNSQKVPQAGSKKKKVKGAPKLTEEEVDVLKRELVQKESKRAAQAARDRHADVLREHKKKERELVKSGKKAYFLKNSDVKQQVLTKQFEGMSEGKRDKMMEKRRKRIASKERRFMPESRRSA